MSIPPHFSLPVDDINSADAASYVPVTLFAPLNGYNASFLRVTPQLLSSSVVAERSLRFRYVAPVGIVSVSPMVIFTRGGANMTIQADNIIEGGGLMQCVWTQEGLGLPSSNTVSTPAVLMFDGMVGIGASSSVSPSSTVFVSCLSPMLLAGDVSLTLSTNGYVETASSARLITVDAPILQSLTPARSLVNTNVTVVVRGQGIGQGMGEFATHKALCRFTQGSTVVGVTPAIINSSALVYCPVPAAAAGSSIGDYPTTQATAAGGMGGISSQRGVQRIKVVGRVPAREIQAIELSALPNQPTIQRVVTSVWGVQNEIWEVKAAAAVSVANRGVYTLATAWTARSEVQRVIIRPSAYVQEMQYVALVAIVTPIEEAYRAQQDTGVVRVAVGYWNTTVYWNATADQFQQVIQRCPLVRDVTVTRTHGTKLVPGAWGNNIRIWVRWTLTFGIADGNMPQVLLPTTPMPNTYLSHPLVYHLPSITPSRPAD